MRREGKERSCTFTLAGVSGGDAGDGLQEPFPRAHGRQPSPGRHEGRPRSSSRFSMATEAGPVTPKRAPGVPEPGPAPPTDQEGPRRRDGVI